MADQETTRNHGVDTQEWLVHAPKVSDALRKGMAVTVTTWGGREVSGLVCDREQAGMLLEVRETAEAQGKYVFLPWSSVEQVEIPEIVQRRVKFLPG